MTTRIPDARTLRLTALAMLFCAAAAAEQASYYDHIIFDNSLTPTNFYASDGSSIAPSSLKLDRGRIPVETEIFRTPPNALRLEWHSVAGGSWEAILRVEGWRNRPPRLVGDTLLMELYSQESIPNARLPRIQLSDRDGGFSVPLPLGKYVPTMHAKHWVEARIPIRDFASLSLYKFEPRRLGSIHFLQGETDKHPRTLIIDEVRVDDATPARTAVMAPPQNVHAKGYDRHIDLSWTPSRDPNVTRYVVYRSYDDIHFTPIGIQTPLFSRYTDYIGKQGQKAFYRITASDRGYRESAPSRETEAATRALNDDEMLDMVQEASIRYYWDGAHPVSGLALENIPGDDDLVATGASGFGIMALIVGVQRGFVPRDAAVERMLKIAQFLDKADRFHGVWPHFLNGRTGRTMPVFGKYDNGGDVVETAFLMQGLLAARQFFLEPTEAERTLRDRITRLWETVEWNWYRRTDGSDFLFWHWSNDYTWHINHKLIGWNETMIVYLLAIASPTHPVPPSMYYTGWASQAEEAIRYRNGGRSVPGDHYANGTDVYGIKLDIGARQGGPLFFTHYSFLGFDPRGLRDKYTNYFDNNRAIALINRAYCIENPRGFPGYGKSCWGLTASDGPQGYTANEPNPTQDDGTIAPTGALSSMPYTPGPSMDALKYYYIELGPLLWDVYGYRDAVNLKEDWVAHIYMGLNQAPIAVMIENYRSGLLWKLFMGNPEIRPMLERIGFHPDKP